MRTHVRSMAEGWLTDRDRHLACRFHRDENSWVREPMVLVDLRLDLLLDGVAMGRLWPAAHEPHSRPLFRNA